MDRVSFIEASEHSRAATPWSIVTTRSNFTLSSTFTTSSTNTVPGIGSITGKGIFILGKATLRGVEYFIVRRRLNVIASKLSQAKTLQEKDIESIYDDLLELARPDMYLRNVRDRAVHLLLAQIGARRTGQLVKCLIQWPSVEMQMFIFTLLDIIDPIRASETDTVAVKAYTSSVSSEERHSLIPFVDFLKQVVSSNSVNGTMLSKILQSSLLDFLLRAYLIDFRDDLADLGSDNFRAAAAMQASCISLFLTLYQTHKRSVAILNHAFKDIMWPNQAPLQRHPSRVHIEATEDRGNSARAIITKRLHIWRMQPELKVKSNPEEFVIPDVYADLMMLAGTNAGNAETSVHALRCLYELVLCPVFSVSTPSSIGSFLTSRDEKEAVEIMSQVIVHLWRLSLLENPEFDFYRVGWASPGTDNRTDMTLHFMQLFSNLGMLNPTCRRILLSANILGLMRPLLAMEMRGHPDFHMVNHQGDFALIYDYKDLFLLELIKSKRLDAVLAPIPREIGGIQNSSLHRRTVLSYAFDVFLGNHEIFQQDV